MTREAPRFARGEKGQKTDILSVYKSNYVDVLTFATIEGLTFVPGRSLGPTDELPPGSSYPWEEIKAAMSAEEKDAREKPDIFFFPKTIVGTLDLRAFKRNGKTCFTYDTKPLPNAAQYRSQLTADTEEGAKLRQELGSPHGIAIALITADNQLVVQLRGDYNRSYPGILQGSAGGYLEQQLANKTGALKPITQEHLFAGISKVAKDEIAVKPEDLYDKKEIAIARDTIRPHIEVCFMGRVKKTAQQLIQNAQESQLTADTEPRSNLRERFFTIDATPESIQKLLGEVHVPFSSTHTALYLATGRMLCLERGETEEQAEQWTRETAKAIEKNHKIMNGMIKTATGKESYDYRILPEEQGLPPRTMEIERVFGIKTN